MSRTPVEELQSRTGVEKREDETVQEYVDRVGANHDVDPDMVAGAHAYITEWYYSDNSPDEDGDFRTLLREAGRPDRRADAGDRVTDVASSSACPDETECDEQSDRAAEAEATVDAVPDTSRHRKRLGADKPRFKTGTEERGMARLLFRFVVIVAMAPVIGWLMARSLVPGYFLYDRVRALSTEMLGIPSIAAVDFVAIFGIGFYVGLLVLFVSDIKKCVQGMLLVLRTVLAFEVVGYLGVFFPSFEVSTLTVFGFGLGLVAGLAMDAGNPLAIDLRESTFQWPTLEGGVVSEFRYAALSLFCVASVVASFTGSTPVFSATEDRSLGLASEFWLHTTGRLKPPSVGETLASVLAGVES
jgi:hypothetical protein